MPTLFVGSAPSFDRVETLGSLVEEEQQGFVNEALLHQSLYTVEEARGDVCGNLHPARSQQQPVVGLPGQNPLFAIDRLPERNRLGFNLQTQSAGRAAPPALSKRQAENAIAGSPSASGLQCHWLARPGPVPAVGCRQRGSPGLRA